MSHNTTTNRKRNGFFSAHKYWINYWSAGARLGAALRLHSAQLNPPVMRANGFLAPNSFYSRFVIVFQRLSLILIQESHHLWIIGKFIGQEHNLSLVISHFTLAIYLQTDHPDSLTLVSSLSNHRAG